MPDLEMADMGNRQHRKMLTLVFVNIGIWPTCGNSQHMEMADMEILDNLETGQTWKMTDREMDEKGGHW